MVFRASRVRLKMDGVEAESCGSNFALAAGSGLSQAAAASSRHASAMHVDPWSAPMDAALTCRGKEEEGRGKEATRKVSGMLECRP